jgi:hippurate hydrolase
LRQTAEGVAAALGGSVEINDALSTPYPVTVNHARETQTALDVARQVAGAQQVDDDVPPVMGGEDFAYMLKERPGAMVWIGNGDSAYLHNPHYDFNDDVIPHGVSYWVSLAETLLATAKSE